MRGIVVLESNDWYCFEVWWYCCV